jgi:hypothetical protein
VVLGSSPGLSVKKQSKAASVGGLFHLRLWRSTLARGQGCNPVNQLIVKYAPTPTHAVTAKENETRSVICHPLKS